MIRTVLHAGAKRRKIRNPQVTNQPPSTLSSTLFGDNRETSRDIKEGKGTTGSRFPG